MSTTPARTTNPTLLVVSNLTGHIAHRTTWVQWAVDNEFITGTSLQQIADKLVRYGIAEVNDHYLIDITPTDAEIVAWLDAKAKSAADMPGMRVGCCQSYYKPFFAQHENCPSTQFADTASEAVDLVRREWAPEKIAASKRARAAELLAEAERMERTQPAAA